MRRTIALLAMTWAATAAVAAGPTIKPETIVTFPQSGIACLSQDGLRSLLMYSVKGEKTKAAAMMIGSGDPDAECVPLEPKKRYRVISAEYNSPDLPDLGLLEVIGMGITSRKGAWTLSVGAVPTK